MKKWSDPEVEILRANYLDKTHRELAALLPGRTPKAVNTKLKKLGLIKIMFRWSEEQVQFLRENYANEHSQLIADRLGVKVSAVWHKAAKLGLEKSKEWIAQNAKANMDRPDHPGKLTQFRKGHESWNKNTKGLTSANSTSFRKGNLPHNHSEVGTESFVDGYWKVKISEPNVWKWKHRLIWEQHHGEIPKGHAVIFKDGNSSNCSLENLELLTRRELRIRNSIHNQYPPDLKGAIYTLSGLKHRITTIKRRKENAQEQNG